MLCRYNRNRFFRDIVSLFQAFLVNIREPFFYIERNRFQGKPYVLRVVLFHLAVDLTGYHVTRLQFIGETLAIFIEQYSALSADRFRNQETAAFLLGIQRCWVNLYVIDIFQRYVPVNCNCKCISCQMREVRRIIINSADTAACPDHIPGINRNQLSFFIPDQNTLADIFAGKNITHFRVRKKRHVRQLFYLREKLARNLLSGYIVVEQDSVGRMCAFFRIAEFSVLIATEIHTPGDELIDNISGRTDPGVFS